MTQYQVYYWRQDRYCAERRDWHKAGHQMTKDEVLEDYNRNRAKYEDGVRKAVKITETPVVFETVVSIKENK